MPSTYPGSLDNFSTGFGDSTTMAATHAGAHNDERSAINAVQAELGLDPSASYATVRDRLDALATSAGFYSLVYDTTGVTNAAPLLQAAIDTGVRKIHIPAGVFYANSAVFDDLQNGNSALYILAHGVLFKAGAGLPTVTEWDSFQTARSRLTGTKWFLFSNTLRTALSGGVVTANGAFATGSSTYPTARVGVSPHLVVEGGTWNASDITNYNAGFAFGNRGGAADISRMHMSSARALLSWWDYVDGNKMSNCGGWGATNMTATNDAALFYQINSGDAVYIHGCKTDNYMLTCSLYSCNGGYINSVVGGGGRLEYCHGITIDSNHTELAANIAVVPRNGWDIQDSHVTYNTAFDYAPESQAANGSLYINDTGSTSEGKHSNIQINNWLSRHWMSGSTTDPGPGYAIYINRMHDRTRITVHNSFTQTSPVGQYATTFGLTGLQIGGNATNEPTLAAALNTSRDIIGSGTFQIVKTQTSTMSAGQNNPMNITITAVGSGAGIYTARTHITPAFYDYEQFNSPTAASLPSTLTASTAYAYAAAVCNTLPDGTIQYGAVTAEYLQTSPASVVVNSVTIVPAHGFEMYLPTGAYGATLVIWRKTLTGVLATPDRYVALPIGTASGRFVDTGANINQFPWITTLVPVPNTVAATNHTPSPWSLYVGGTLNS